MAKNTNIERIAHHLRKGGILKTVRLIIFHTKRKVFAGNGKLPSQRRKVKNEDILLSLCVLQKEIREIKLKLEQLEREKH